jgi:hypothetical protein
MQASGAPFAMHIIDWVPAWQKRWTKAKEKGSDGNARFFLRMCHDHHH